MAWMPAVSNQRSYDIDIRNSIESGVKIQNLDYTCRTVFNISQLVMLFFSQEHLQKQHRHVQG
jgi:hypothetical protein